MIACSKKTTSSSATQAPAADATPEQLAWEKTCSRCHKLKDPASKTAAQWGPVVDKMQKKGNFSDEVKAQVMTYLTAHAKAQ